MHALPSSVEVYFDAVALPTLDTYKSPLESSQLPGEEPGRRFAKFGLWFRPDRSFEIVLSKGQPSTIGIGWGGDPAMPGIGVVNNPCAGAQPGWAVLPGGVWVTGPTCVSMEVSTGTSRAVVRLGVDETCS